MAILLCVMSTGGHAIEMSQVRSFEYVIADGGSFQDSLAAIRSDPIDLVILNYRKGQVISRTANDPLNSKILIGFISAGSCTIGCFQTYFNNVAPSWFGETGTRMGQSLDGAVLETRMETRRIRPDRPTNRRWI
jgi:hypothetical protein